MENGLMNTRNLSELPPTILDFNATELVVPPSFIVKALGRAILLDPDTKSILLVHSPTHGGQNTHNRYLPWLATMWSIMEHVREARVLWRNAVAKVKEILANQTTSDAAVDHAKAAIEALDILGWDENVKGFKAGGFVERLALWFTTDWLRSDHEDQMLELLASDLGHGATTGIQTSFFVKSLEQAYSDPDGYRTSHKFAWLRRLGSSLATKERTRVGTIGNKDANHWVALGINTD
ncbi:hypothetical protein B0H16DRAFT_1691918 [Mycena metata]|uniref:Uncharacterized protein n=1 Tax=Mycena metata TaxID=1033252 RepID=A0AAD7ITK1_9AGAR|nr:hypothetical protein B0H16DRAFT_1691918 [Mycena metata]